MVIKSKDNKKIKLARCLKEKKYRQQERLFIMEGQRAVLELCQRKELVHSIFLDIVVKGEYPELEEKFARDIHFVDKSLLKYISATIEPQAFIAIAKMPSWDWQDLLEQSDFLLYLDRISDPGNLGSIIRTAWALAVDAIILSPQSLDLYNPKVVRASMGSILNIPCFNLADIKPLEQIKVQLKEKGFSLLSADLDSNHSYRHYDYQQKTLLMMGSEAHGLDLALKALSDKRVKIPMISEAESINVAAACAIILEQAYHQRFKKI